eukprot:Nitzschia sp. Nitz4//scaffold25_size161228//141701//143197//NITZ4_002454-RA/size161228-processed-gene-0.198-mRNA-1//-1//CDS//3329544658//6601//frame0
MESKGEGTFLVSDATAANGTTTPYGGPTTTDTQHPPNNAPTASTAHSHQEGPFSLTTAEWMTLLLSLGVGLVSGSLYGFGRYSRDLKDTMGISQMMIQRFGILMDLGNYIGHPFTGWVYDHFGPRISCLAAAVVVFTSYGSIYLALTSAPLWVMALGFLGVGFGSGMGYIAALGSTTSTFVGTHHLGRAVGFVAGSYGMSSTLVGISYRMLGLERFFLFWAILVAVMNIMGAYVFLPPKESGHGHGHHGESEEQVVVDQEGQPNGDEPLLGDHAESSASTKWKSWARLDFWLLLISFACITGCGLMVINNISTMVQSIGGADSFAGDLVFGLSLSNVFGRLLMGSLTDLPNLHKMDLFRYTSLAMAFALLISAIGGASSLCLAVTVVLSVVSYGGAWVLIIGILADFFGKEHFGKDYGLIAMGPALSGMFFNTLSAKLYEHHADPDTGTCVGANCYGHSFFLAALSAVVGYLILWWAFPTRNGRMAPIQRSNDPADDE